MRVRHGLFGLVALGLALSQASAQSFERTSFIFRKPACDSCASPASGPVMVVPTDPKDGKDQAPQVVDAQAFAQAPAAGGELGYSFNPAMFGDLGAGAVGIRRSTSSSSSSHSAAAPVAASSASQVAIISRGAFKISDNESPRPTDRVFLTYNYFQGIQAGNGQSYDLHRDVLGFEKTFLDGFASFEMRMPYMNTSGGVDGIQNHLFGDMSIIGKAALYDDCQTGNLVSVGLDLTVPTADHQTVLADGSNLRDVLIQPYIAWIYNMDRFYAEGFHSIIIPTDHRDVTSLDNDVSVGYWVYKAESGANGVIRGIVPTLEGHLYTPLNHNNDSDIIVARDVFTLTGGVNVVLPGNTTFGAAIAAPLTGPRPNNLEALAGFNFRF